MSLSLRPGPQAVAACRAANNLHGRGTRSRCLSAYPVLGSKAQKLIVFMVSDAIEGATVAGSVELYRHLLRGR